MVVEEVVVIAEHVAVVEVRKDKRSHVHKHVGKDGQAVGHRFL